MDDGWDVKVTSKGQITLPKSARDILLVREGDHLEAFVQDDSLVLKKRELPTQSEMLVRYARERLRTSSGTIERIDVRSVRNRIGKLQVDTTALVREGREKR